MNIRPRFLTPLSIITLSIALLTLSSFFGATGVSGAADSWSRTGPVAGHVTALSVSTSNPSVVYAGIASDTGGSEPASTMTGVYKTTDGGANWTRAGLAGKALRSLAVDPTDPGKVYAGTFSNGLYKSIDGGTTWSGPFVNQFADIYSLAIDPGQPSILYCSASNRSLLKSIDSGVTWSNSSTGITFAIQNSIAIDPTNTNTIYVSAGSNVYKTTNAGANWAVSSTGIPSSSHTVAAVTLSPGNNSILYVGLGSDVYKSIDSAGSWTKVSTGLLDATVTKIAIDPSNPLVVFVATITKGIFKTVDGGGSWISAGLNTSGVNTIQFQGTSSLNIFAGTRGSGVVKTTDGGSSWRQSSNIPYADVREIVIDPNNSSVLYAYSSDALSVSMNRGVDWTANNLTTVLSLLPGFPSHHIAIDPTNSSTFYVAVNFLGLYKTTDSGITWNRIFQTIHLRQLPSIR